MVSSQDFRSFLNYYGVKFKEKKHDNGHVEFYYSVGAGSYYKRRLEVIFMPDVESIFIQVLGIDISFLPDKGKKFFEKSVVELNANQKGIFKFGIDSFDEAFAYTEYPNRYNTTMENLKNVIEQGIQILYLLENLYDICFDAD